MTQGGPGNASQLIGTYAYTKAFSQSDFGQGSALAMIMGMIPMALGLGEGGEENAPLGRAVIGGLILATVATLIFVPAVFSLLHRRSTAQPQPAE